MRALCILIAATGLCLAQQNNGRTRFAIKNPVTNIQGLPVSSAAPGNGQVLTWNSSKQTWEPQNGPNNAPLAGDVSGTVGNNTVTKIQNYPISPTGPLNNQFLVWNAGNVQWEPATRNLIWFVDPLVPSSKFSGDGLLDWVETNARGYDGGGISCTGSCTITTRNALFRLDVSNFDSFLVHKLSNPSSTLIMGFTKNGTALPDVIGVRRNSNGTFDGICLGSTATISPGSQPGLVFRTHRVDGGKFLFSVNGGVETSLSCNPGANTFSPLYNVVHTGSGSTFLFRYLALQVDDWF